MINPSRIFGAIGLTGGGEKTLDSFPSNMMQQDHAAVVIDGSNIYFYVCDIDSGLDENIPFVIKPDDIELSITPSNNTKRWIMISPKYFDDNIIQTFGKYIQTSQIKAINGQLINLISSDGEIISVDTDGTLLLNNAVITGQLTVNNEGRNPPFIVDSTLKVNNLNSDMVDGFHADSFIKIDGSTPFIEPQQGVDPVNDNELATKYYVDNIINNPNFTIQKGVADLVQGADNITVQLNSPLTNYTVIITLENTLDVDPSQYGWTIIRKTTTEFDVLFTGYIDSPNYKINWVAYPLN